VKIIFPPQRSGQHKKGDWDDGDQTFDDPNPVNTADACQYWSWGVVDQQGKQKQEVDLAQVKDKDRKWRKQEMVAGKPPG
jgi:hypothetical protein